MELFKWFAETHGEQGLGKFFFEEERMRVNTSRQRAQPAEPRWIGNCQIVAGPAHMTGSKESPILAFTFFIANPPPQIVRMDEFERLFNRRPVDFAAIDPIPVSL